VKYSKRKGARVKGDPNVIGSELARLQRLHGKLTPEIVVDAARDKKSPLHGEFDWDKDRAARAHWMHQARMLLADITYDLDEEKEIRAFVNVTRDDGRVYADTKSTLSDPELRAQVLDRLQAEADDWAQRAENYREFAEAVRVIRKTSKKRGKRKRPAA
jgi:hypothetical protein